MALTLAQRLAAFPTTGLAVRRPVRIRWNAHAVPYIEAQTDHDAAYALGLVHHHLRAAQLHIHRLIAQGRVSEMLGPFTVDLDHALRILDLPGAARRVEASLPATTRAWLDPFVAGLNDHQQRAREAPAEFRWLGTRFEPWTVLDVLTLSRLAGSDVNWAYLLELLRRRTSPGFAKLWARTRTIGGTLAATPLGEALAMLSKVGSNSVAISAQRSSTGAPLIANDPHLGLFLPNFWLLAGLRSPTYRMIGLMAPGLPFVGVGRGTHFAWGGTNMRAASTDLVDVSNLPASDIREGTVRIKVRGLGWRTRHVRVTPHGPILNDARQLRIAGGLVALKWIGHEVSDEIGAFLAASRATTPDEFRAALAGFGVCPQNMQFASPDGHIGHVHAARLPRRARLPGDDPVLSPEEADVAWRERWNAASLPMTLDPEDGYLVSANDLPRRAGVPLGFFYSEGARAARLAELASQRDLTLEKLAAFQRDTRTPGAERLARTIADLLEGAGVEAGVCRLLRDWDGDYAVGATAPVAFEAALAALARRLAAAPGDPTELDGEWGRLTRLLLPDLAALSPAVRTAMLVQAGREARKALDRFPTWGDCHRLRITHVLGLVPVLGRRYVVADLPVGGSRETPMKTAHGLVSGRHGASYGAQSRHLSDLSDPDANHFCLLGGNDGWIGSAQFADQVPLWREGRYVHMPMRPASVAAAFPEVLDLAPAEGARSPTGSPSGLEPAAAK